MSDLLWVKMPSGWISNNKLRRHFSSPSGISTDIAALKIYMCLCLNSDTIQRKQYSEFSMSEIIDDRFESCMTYDQLGEMASLSRVLISRGITKLKETGLITDEGTTRKKCYVLTGNPRRGWCKMPRKDILKKDGIVSAFTSFTQRYPHERDALKIFLYLLSIRQNSKRYIAVSRGAITEATGVGLASIDGALGFLRSIGLLEKIESKGYIKRKSELLPNEQQRLHRYFVTGCKTLNLRSVLVETEYDAPQ